MEYSVSELLNVFGYYLDYGMTEALRVHPWHKEFLRKNRNKTLQQLEIELYAGQKELRLQRPKKAGFVRRLKLKGLNLAK